MCHRTFSLPKIPSLDLTAHTPLEVALDTGLVTAPSAKGNVVGKHFVHLCGRTTGALGHDEEGEDSTG